MENERGNATSGLCRRFAPVFCGFRSVNGVTVLAGFFRAVVYTQRRVPDTEKTYGYQKEVKQKSFEAKGREEAQSNEEKSGSQTEGR